MSAPLVQAVPKHNGKDCSSQVSQKSVLRSISTVDPAGRRLLRNLSDQSAPLVGAVPKHEEENLKIELAAECSVENHYGPNF